eukprot:gb/GECG01012517.1/.p1 GENE.gb/GECG01012517.1/~~gb/GECG01012517.1/.p1  ORF type:complete len:2063 (+),score=220.60 gb/GECG01012517.1/:1-6189(+)
MMEQPSRGNKVSASRSSSRTVECASRPSIQSSSGHPTTQTHENDNEGLIEAVTGLSLEERTSESSAINASASTSSTVHSTSYRSGSSAHAAPSSAHEQHVGFAPPPAVVKGNTQEQITSPPPRPPTGKSGRRGRNDGGDATTSVRRRRTQPSTQTQAHMSTHSSNGSDTGSNENVTVQEPNASSANKRHYQRNLNESGASYQVNGHAGINDVGQNVSKEGEAGVDDEWDDDVTVETVANVGRDLELCWENVYTMFTDRGAARPPVSSTRNVGTNTSTDASGSANGEIDVEHGKEAPATNAEMQLVQLKEGLFDLWKACKSCLSASNSMDLVNALVHETKAIDILYKLLEAFGQSQEGDELAQTALRTLVLLASAVANEAGEVDTSATLRLLVKVPSIAELIRKAMGGLDIHKLGILSTSFALLNLVLVADEPPLNQFTENNIISLLVQSLVLISSYPEFLNSSVSSFQELSDYQGQHSAIWIFDHVNLVVSWLHSMSWYSFRNGGLSSGEKDNDHITPGEHQLQVCCAFNGSAQLLTRIIGLCPTIKQRLFRDGMLRKVLEIVGMLLGYFWSQPSVLAQPAVGAGVETMEQFSMHPCSSSAIQCLAAMVENSPQLQQYIALKGFISIDSHSCDGNFDEPAALQDEVPDPGEYDSGEAESTHDGSQVLCCLLDLVPLMVMVDPSSCACQCSVLLIQCRYSLIYMLTALQFRCSEIRVTLESNFLRHSREDGEGITVLELLTTPQIEGSSDSSPHADVRPLRYEIVEVLHLCSRVLKCIYSMRKSHYDESIVVESLNDLSRLIGHSHHRSLAKYIVFCSFGSTGVRILTHSLQNIDEAVMERACHVLLALLSCNPCQCKREPNADIWLTALTHRRFAQAGGFSALSGCLHDYDANIRGAALKVIESMFRFSSASESGFIQANLGIFGQAFEPASFMRDGQWETLRGNKIQRLSTRSGLLSLVLKTLHDWPNKETPARVATAAVDVLSQAVRGDQDMQTYWGTKGAISLLVRILMRASRRMWAVKKRIRAQMAKYKTNKGAEKKTSSKNVTRVDSARQPVKSVPPHNGGRNLLPPLSKSKRHQSRTTENLQYKSNEATAGGTSSRPCSAPISRSRHRLSQENMEKDARATVHPRQRGKEKHTLRRGFLLLSESDSASEEDELDMSSSDTDDVNAEPSKSTLFSWDREDIETAKLMANATTALTNLVFKHPENQLQFILDGGLRLILRLLAGRWLHTRYQQGRRSVKQAFRRSSNPDLTLLEHIDELSRDNWANLCYDLSFVHETRKDGTHLISDEELNAMLKLVLRNQAHGCCLPPDSTDPEIVASSRNLSEAQFRSESTSRHSYNRPARPHRSAVARTEDTSRDRSLAVLSMWGEDATNGILSIITNLIDQNQISQAVLNTPATIKLFQNMLSSDKESPRETASLDSRTHVCWIISHLTLNHTSLQESTGAMLPGIVRFILEVVQDSVDTTGSDTAADALIPQWLVKTCQRAMEPLQQWSRSDIYPDDKSLKECTERPATDSGLAAYTKSALDIPEVEEKVVPPSDYSDGTNASQTTTSPRTLAPLSTHSTLEKSATRTSHLVQRFIKEFNIAPSAGPALLVMDIAALQRYLAAVSAIVNQTYRNSHSQLVAGQAGVIHLLISMLHSLIVSYQKWQEAGGNFDLVKNNAAEFQFVMGTIGSYNTVDLISQLIEAIVLALGNLVRDCSPNAEALASCGGLPVLLTLINDADEDLLSKRVFLTLQHCGIFALQGLLSMVHTCCSLVDPRETLPAECVDRFLQEFPDISLSAYSTGAIQNLSENEQMIQWLSKCLPVLNGILFDAPGVKHWLIQQSNWLGGLGPLVRVVIAPIPVSIILYAANVIANLASGAIVTLQRYASKSAIVDILLFIAITATAEGENSETADTTSTGSGSESGLHQPAEDEQDGESALSEAKSVLYSALVSLCVYCQPNCERICATERALDVLISDTESRGCEKEDATELLIVVAECACEVARHIIQENDGSDASQSLLWSTMAQEKVLHVLQRIKRDYGGTATSVGARAAQCIVTLSGQEVEVGRGLALHT